MEDRFNYRVAFFDNQDKFIGFGYYDMVNGIAPYNAGMCHIGKIELCTGLKDKNGKLIYEGDIVKYIDCEKKETIGYLCVDRFNLLTFTDAKGVDFCEEWSDIVKAVFFTGTSQIEIIGNIYENKELLEEQK